MFDKKLRGIEAKELKLIGLFAVLGWLFSRQQFVAWLCSLNPLQGLLVWYAAFTLFIHFMLRGLGINLGALQVKSWSSRHTAAFAIFFFCFNIVWNWAESAWASYSIGGTGELPNVLVMSEDGVVFWLCLNYVSKMSFPFLFWQQPVAMAVDLTYILTPVLGMLFAAFLLTPTQMAKAVARMVRGG